MSKRDDLIAVYTQDLKEKCGEKNPDVEFLTKVTVGLGPCIYNNDASKVPGSDQTELDKAIDAVLEKYGKSNKSKYRAVVYYLLAKHFKKESVYNK